MADDEDEVPMAEPMPLGQQTVVRTIRIDTADGQAHVFEYETTIKRDRDKALEREIKQRLVETPIWHLQTLSNGTTATFTSEIVNAQFLGPVQPEED